MMKNNSFIKEIIYAIIAILVFAYFLGSCSDSDKSENDSDSTQETVLTESDDDKKVSNKTKKAKYYYEGDSLKIDGLSLTLNKVAHRKHKSLNKKGKHWVICIFEIKNNTDSDFDADFDFKAECDGYEIDDEIIVSTPESDKYEELYSWDEVRKGKKRIGYVGYEVPDDFKKIQIDTEISYGFFGYKNKKGTFLIKNK